MPGKVYLIGAGPGDPELLTIKALWILKAADVVLHDALVGPEILAFVPATAHVQNVGKRCGGKSTPQDEINRLLVNYARLDLQVVRLKGGDPLVFGRGGEEIEALRAANIEFEIVPGVTAALGAAAAAGIPLTHRTASSALLFLTSQRSKSADKDGWPRLSPNVTTVIYMPGHDYAEISRRLIAAGLAGDTPCALVSHATSASQKLHVSIVAELAVAPDLPAPTLLVVGEVVRFARRDSSSLDWVAASFDCPELISLLTETGFLAHGQELLAQQERSE